MKTNQVEFYVKIIIRSKVYKRIILITNLAKYASVFSNRLAILEAKLLAVLQNVSASLDEVKPIVNHYMHGKVFGSCSEKINDCIVPSYTSFASQLDINVRYQMPDRTIKTIFLLSLFIFGGVPITSATLIQVRQKTSGDHQSVASMTCKPCNTCDLNFTSKFDHNRIAEYTDICLRDENENLSEVPHIISSDPWNGNLLFTSSSLCTDAGSAPCYFDLYDTRACGMVRKFPAAIDSKAAVMRIRANIYKGNILPHKL